MNTRPITILLAEDNEDDVLLAQEAFAEVPLARIAAVARNGDEALAYLRREGKYAQARPPDLVLLDINMPRKSGFEVLAEMKSDPSLRHVPVLMLSTSEQDEDILRSYRGGASSYITKPMLFEGFVELAQELLSYWTRVSRLPRAASS